MMSCIVPREKIFAKSKVAIVGTLQLELWDNGNKFDISMYLLL